jgi:hypothetical protein
VWLYVIVGRKLPASRGWRYLIAFLLGLVVAAAFLFGGLIVWAAPTECFD